MGWLGRWAPSRGSMAHACGCGTVAPPNRTPSNPTCSKCCENCKKQRSSASMADSGHLRGVEWGRRRAGDGMGLLCSIGHLFKRLTALGAGLACLQRIPVDAPGRRCTPASRKFRWKLLAGRFPLAGCSGFHRRSWPRRAGSRTPRRPAWCVSRTLGVLLPPLDGTA